MLPPRPRCWPPQDAAAALAQYDLLLLLDARRPVANFGYDGAPSHLVALPVRHPQQHGATAQRELADG